MKDNMIRRTTLFLLAAVLAVGVHAIFFVNTADARVKKIIRHPRVVHVRVIKRKVKKIKKRIGIARPHFSTVKKGTSPRGATFAAYFEGLPSGTRGCIAKRLGVKNIRKWETDPNASLGLSQVAKVDACVRSYGQ